MKKKKNNNYQQVKLYRIISFNKKNTI